MSDETKKEKAKLKGNFNWSISELEANIVASLLMEAKLNHQENQVRDAMIASINKAFEDAIAEQEKKKE